jgi:hypothetical protein
MNGMRTASGPILVCLTLLLTLGAVHGIYTDRWGPSGKLEEALAALPQVPMKFGDWTGEDVPYEADALTRAGIKGGVFRRFTNVRTRESISLLIVCGRGGPISVHTPDICYSAAGYQQLAPELRKEVENGENQKDWFYVARFGKPAAVVPVQLEIYWTWSRDGVTWHAPENPRLSLARAPALYKLYVVREYAPKSRAEAAATSEKFLRQALPAIRQSLSSSAES